MLHRATILSFILGAAGALGTAATAQTQQGTSDGQNSAIVLPSRVAPGGERGPMANTARSAPPAPETPAERLSRIRPTPGTRPGPDLGDRLDPVAANTRALAMHVRDLDSGEVLYDRAGDRGQNPASSHKVVTATAALELLGPGYRFETRLIRDGDTLYLVGEGDPTLLVDDLHALATQLVAAGAHEGLRRLVVDDTAFSGLRFGPGFDMEGDAAYLAPSSAVSLQFNTIEIVVEPGEFGQDANVRVDPPSSAVRVINRAHTGHGPALHVSTHHETDVTVVQVTGAIPAGHATVIERRRVMEPAAFTGGALARILADMTGTTPLPVSRGAAPDLEPTATHASAPLSRVITAALKYSNNFTAEQILRTVGWRHSGQPGDWTNGVAAVQAWWQATGGDPEALSFINGSGLNRDGRATARALVDVLAHASHAPEIGPALLAALPGAGRDGTLQNRMELANGRIRAKTGTMNGVSTLTGVVVSRDGDRRIGFSILMGAVTDSSQARALQNRLAIKLLEYADHA